MNRLPLGRRLKDAANLVIGAYPVIFIKVKPDAMVQPRPPSHVFTHLLAQFEERRAAMLALAAEVAAAAPATDIALAGLESGHFWGGDAHALYAMITRLKPARIVEVGCGNSTRIMRTCIQNNQLGTVLTCIDPQPRADITSFADVIHTTSLLDVGMSVFEDLQAGDILFLDGSHYVFNGSDPVFFALEIAPLLAPGVVVHIHDLHLPFEYSAAFTERHYNEQYLIAAMLLGGTLEPLLPVYWLAQQGALAPGGSFWAVIPPRPA